MINYYEYKGKYFFSFQEYDNFNKIHEEEVKKDRGKLYFLNRLNPIKSRRSFLINHPSLLFIEKEGVELLLLDTKDYFHLIPPWIINKIDDGLVLSLNTCYPNWEEVLDQRINKKWKVNLLALGDVGSTLLIGLRLMGEGCIDKIGIYDRNINRLKRWEYELNQIRKPFDEEAFPPIYPLDRNKLFDCHIFIFCASKGIPPVGSTIDDVRMAQFESNSEIIKEYAIMARNKGFKGIFAIVSDPVDLLCKVAFLESNKNEKSEYDFQGLASNQIIGYGLGVMNGRACFYAEKSKDTIHYLREGRVFGPHGEGLIVADSIDNYNKKLSEYLTYKTLNANKEVRNFGFKPYVAPSLSSGALSIIATIKGKWFYGSTYMGGAYMGSKCRLIDNQIEVEQLDMPSDLFNKIKDTYERLVNII
ncbi:Malate/lactate dehydrogenase-like protein [[Clostridium] ultunense Esp]|uniref:Malate/lactate dehydrogenase-like protein n=1 Tax=[Clostridium] ultunense Esp TaxID=1288971 RepID=M1ZFK6_9FIRM|nr:Malate/lactate dehydrogenase-like protein [Schnuerera ultunensis]CCQ97129.1 Malate/lactate dehydrogenase-like protein [[Clostridium] ultunense Esp]SHD78472.1 Malate/lactate dehydrogenase-like protein [[Clostridium] ultunense Esp]